MNRYRHLREKALALRRAGATLTQIYEHLALNKTTVYYWIKDLPIPRTTRQTAAQRLATKAMQAKYAARRETWYRDAYAAAAQTLADLTIRDFVVLYAAEGYRRNRNTVSLANSNPAIIHLAHAVIRRMSRKPNCAYSLQCHVDNDEAQLQKYWAAVLHIEPSQIRVTRKSNAGHLSGRQWRSQYGVLTVTVSDTELRSKIQAWMDYLQQHWLPIS